jgi:hypothetical protein
MGLKLLSHVNADSDLIEAWVRYYLQLGIEQFHFIVHGPAEENRRLITIEDTYGGPFDGEQKKARLDALLKRTPDQWVMLVDSDEFVEFPYEDIQATIKKLEFAHANVLVAPMLQRVKEDGTLESPSVIEDPFTAFPLCSEDLYQKMGSNACISKCPLFYCTKETQLLEEGNHNPPRGAEVRTSAMLGVTHHFKFRRTVSERLHKRINSEYTFRHESVQFREYLDGHSNRLPIEGAFTYSREELFRRGLLRKLSLRNNLKSLGRTLRIAQ